MAKKTKKPVKKVTAKISSQSIFETYEKLKATVDGMDTDVRKFADNGVGSAGGRIRKAAMEIKRMMSQYRKDVMELKRARKAGK